MSKILVLCSGGLDSVVVAAHLRGSLRQEVALLYVSYGSRAQEKELEVLSELSHSMGVGHVVLPMPGLSCLTSGLTRTEKTDPSTLRGAAAWVPARNLILVSLALAYGSTRDYDAVAIGNVADGIYPDNKPPFTDQFNKLIPHAIGPDSTMRVLAPVGHLRKSFVVKLGESLEVPFEKTWSCYETGRNHCGVCGSCVSRRNAFMVSGVKDPTVYDA